MARKIKGITVEIGGDTTKLDKALSDTNKSLGETQRSLRDVERLLKLDPKNTVLLEQKQRLLADAVSDTSKKLETLKTAAEQSGDELRKTAEGTKQYDALQREIAETERKLKDLEQQQKDTTSTTKKLSDSMADLEDKTEKVGKVAKNAGKLIAGVATAAIASVGATEDYRDSLSKLETTADLMNVTMEDAKTAMADFYRVTGDYDTAFEAANNLLNLKLQGEGLTTAVDLLSAAVIRFPDTLKIESLADSLQETVATGTATGQFAELLDRLGVSAEEVSASLALYTDENIRLDIALSALASNGLAGVTSAWQAENAELVRSRDANLQLKDSVADLAEELVPLITRVTATAAAFMQWFNGLDSGGKTAVITFAALVAAVGPVIDVMTGLSKILPAVQGFIAGIDGKSAALAITLALLATAVIAIIDAWEDMTGLEKVVSILGALTIAAAGAAIAVGALQSAWSLGLAAAAIVAGVVAITAAVNNAKKRAQADAAAMSYSATNVPALADGAVLYPGKPFLALVGEQRSGVNVEAPMSTIKQGMREVMNERGGGGSVTRVEFTGSLAQLGRVLRPVVTTEAERAGSSMRK